LAANLCGCGSTQGAQKDTTYLEHDQGNELENRVYYSVGGGFVVSDEVAADGSRQKVVAPDTTVLPYPFHSGDDLLRLCDIKVVELCEPKGIEQGKSNDIIWRSLWLLRERGASETGEKDSPSQCTQSPKFAQSVCHSLPRAIAHRGSVAGSASHLWIGQSICSA